MVRPIDAVLKTATERSRAPRWATGLVLVLMLVVAAACGNDDEGGSPGVERFASEYRQVTEDYRAETTAIRDQGQAASGQGLDRLIDLYGSMRTATEDAHDGYAALEPPADYEPTLDRMVELLNDQVAALDRLIESARANELSAVTESAQNLTDLQAEWTTARQEMERLLDECGEPCNA